MPGLRRLDTLDDVLGWFAARGVRGLAADSRRVRAGDAFIAWPGYATDGRRFVPQALARGAAACLVEAEGVEAFGLDDPAVGACAGLKPATGEIAGRWFGDPSTRLDVIAITGTNGKTSTAWWVAQALSHLGQRCGVIGTLGIGEPPAAGGAVAAGSGGASTGSAEMDVGGASTGSARTGLGGTLTGTGSARTEVGGAPTSSAGTDSVRPEPVEGPATPTAVRPEPVEGLSPAAAAFPLEPTGLTTPDPIAIQRACRRYADAGFAACAIEATSIGLAEHRLAGVRVGIAVYTNFTQDHLDYHGSMAAYWQAKAQLFAWPGLRAAVVNVDDEQGAALAASLGARGAIDLWTCSATGPARLRAFEVGYLDGGLGFDLEEAAGAEPPARTRVRTCIVGDFHLGNLLATLGALRASGLPLSECVAACAELTPVPGRMQRVEPSVVPAPDQATSARPLDAASARPAVVVDYAHTPDALDKALQALRPLAAERGGALWCVFGCGGDRDPGKRPLMGAIAARRADRVVLTSDNPRGESPEAILTQIAAGAPGLDERILDRRAAIDHTVRSAAPADVVLIAGKGHEDYQEIAGVRYPLSDVVEAGAALARRESTARC